MEGGLEREGEGMGAAKAEGALVRQVHTREGRIQTQTAEGEGR